MEDSSEKLGDSIGQKGGIIPGTRGIAAWSLRSPAQPAIPVLIAVPHAGRIYPQEISQILRNQEESALRLEDRLIDIVASAVAAQTGAYLLVANAPRAMIDLNRSLDDMDWTMVAGGAPEGRPSLAAGRRSRSGLGLVPRRLTGLGELWRRRMTREELDARIAGVHAPYHRILGETLEVLRDRWGTALLLDLHSMPPLGPKTGLRRAVDFVLGDRFGASCDDGLMHSALHYLEREGQFAAHNRPYAGGYVLDRHGAPARGHNAVQVEVCRAAYLDRELREPGQGLQGVVEVLTGLVQTLAAEMLAGGAGLAEAAE